MNKEQKILKKILKSDNIIESINNNLNNLINIIPEIKDMIGFEHNHPHHHLDVWEHTLYTLSLSNNDFQIRIALLLHDIGKPHCYQDEEVRHFKGHHIVSTNIAKKILKRLNYNNEFIDEVCFLIENHDIPILIEEIQKNYKLYYKLYLIQYCDAYAHNPTKLEKRIKYLEKIKGNLKIR